jgi:hypothetical protein
MADPRTKTTGASVEDFLCAIPNAQIRGDSLAIVEMMQSATKARPKMWGSNIVGFGEYRYLYANGEKANWMLVAFAPRKDHITLYLTDDFEKHSELLSKLGKHSCGKSCLHIRRLADIHLPTLRKLVRESVRQRLSTSVPA